MIRGIELFAGGGGLAQGLGMSGVSHLGLIEMNHDACNTLRRNFDPSIVFEGDAALFEKSRLTDIDFVSGGPPCQPFSLGGRAKGKDDKRDMFPVAVDFVRELQPKAFMFENVKGLLRKSFKEYLEYILLQLEYPSLRMETRDHLRHYHKLLENKRSSAICGDYHVTVNLVNAADYGVPQKRERVIITGIRKDIEKEWRFPAPTHSKDALLWAKWVTCEYWDRHNCSPDNQSYRAGKEIKQKLKKKYGLFPPDLAPWLTIRDVIPLDPICCEKTVNPEFEIRPGAREYPGHSGSDVDEPSKTLKAGAHGVPGGENMLRLSDGTLRYMTVYEAKLIQSFPENYRFSGSWSEAMRQIGNAVPVELARKVSASFLTTVFGKDLVV